MIDRVVYDWAPVVTVVAVMTFFVDYALTRVGASLSHMASERWSIEGSYELNPTWVEHIDSGRWFSWRIVRSAAAIAFLLAAMWVVVAYGELYPAFFAFAAGTILLLQAPVVMLHGQNIVTFHALADPSSAVGTLQVRRWFAYRQSAGYCLAFVALWLVLWLPSQQAFFLGGALSCVLFARRMWRLASDARKTIT